MRPFRRPIAALLLAAAGAASASPVTYDFSLTVSSGPLLGNSYGGSFSYDSSSVVAGTEVDALGLLTALSFTFDGTAYTEATANTGYLEFDASGDLVGFKFGTHCTAGDCSVAGGTSDWALSSFALFYARPGDTGLYFSDGPSFSLHGGGGTAPEPASISLVLAAGAAGIALTRRRRGAPEAAT